MSGHSHWATIRRKKGTVDAKKGRMFSQCAKLIMSAARTGGDDPDMNVKLRYAIEDARAVNMPKDNIERAILKGVGKLEGATLEDIVYEGYAHGGIALLVEAITDNRNRTAPEIRRLFENAGGSMSAPGSVAWMFEKKGVISVKRDIINEDKLMEIVLDAGAEDLSTFEGFYEIICEPSTFGAVRQAIENNDTAVDTAQITNIAKQNVTPSINDASKAIKLMETLEDHDDVQNISANFDIPPELLAEIT